MKKKIVAGMLTLCMAMAFAGCGSDKKNESTDATETVSENTSSEKSGIRLVSVEDTSDYVTLGEYKGITLQHITSEITDDDVELEIENIMADNSSEITDGTVQDQDTVRINYTGTVNGEELEDGSMEDYDLKIGNAVFTEEFDQAMIGMAIGETRQISIAYPEDYYDETVAGKTVDYTVTLQSISRPAQLTDEWVASQYDFTTVDEYKAYIRQQLEDNNSKTADLELYSNAWIALCDAAEVKDYPEEDIDKAKEEYKASYDSFLEASEMTMEDFLESQDMTEEEFDEECESYAKSKVEQDLIAQAVMDAEGLSLEDEEMESVQSLLLQQYGYDSIDSMISDFGEDSVNEILAIMRVEKFVVDQATVEEMVGANGEAIAVNAAAYDDSTEPTDEELTADASGEVSEQEIDDTEDAAAEEVTE